ncbi:hypothetical protein POM88_049743 [Heracleum sosnowskyi]|uniref:DUF7906 domain-containing protein n=1 Tax=Heracleum sosnowskyi TaxID=360622 RepID=A0AAD8GYP1_9APIA|nr:hypothetical protein POM88_049743 [Heracleum sosnowskyi]
MKVDRTAEEMNRTAPSAIFIVNFDKVMMDPYNKDIDLDSLMYGKINQLTEKEMKKQEGDYIYQYRYNGGGSSQIWLGSGSHYCVVLSIFSIVSQRTQDPRESGPVILWWEGGPFYTLVG